MDAPLKDLQVGPLRESEREDWERLVRAYRAGYRAVTQDAFYPHLWERLMQGGILLHHGARLDGRLVGVAHSVLQMTVWVPVVGYLSDLYVDPSARGLGAGRALVRAAARDLRERGAGSFYWMTDPDNEAAHALYGSIARRDDWVRYQFLNLDAA